MAWNVNKYFLSDKSQLACMIVCFPFLIFSPQSYIISLTLDLHNHISTMCHECLYMSVLSHNSKHILIKLIAIFKIISANLFHCYLEWVGCTICVHLLARELILWFAIAINMIYFLLEIQGDVGWWILSLIVWLFPSYCPLSA